MPAITIERVRQREANAKKAIRALGDSAPPKKLRKLKKRKKRAQRRRRVMAPAPPVPKKS